MRRKIGNFLTACFVSLSLGVVVAQTVYPCPPHCSQKSLEDTYGDDWHLWYFLLGCWLLPESCQISGLPAQAISQRNVRFR